MRAPLPGPVIGGERPAMPAPRAIDGRDMRYGDDAAAARPLPPAGPGREPQRPWVQPQPTPRPQIDAPLRPAQPVPPQMQQPALLPRGQAPALERPQPPRFEPPAAMPAQPPQRMAPPPRAMPEPERARPAPERGAPSLAPREPRDGRNRRFEDNH
jgi:hypothetical protein